MVKFYPPSGLTPMFVKASFALKGVIYASEAARLKVCGFALGVFNNKACPFLHKETSYTLFRKEMSYYLRAHRASHVAQVYFTKAFGKSPIIVNFFRCHPKI